MFCRVGFNGGPEGVVEGGVGWGDEVVVVGGGHFGWNGVGLVKW